jgi:hypothetical protein
MLPPPEAPRPNCPVVRQGVSGSGTVTSRPLGNRTDTGRTRWRGGPGGPPTRSRRHRAKSVLSRLPNGAVHVDGSYLMGRSWQQPEVTRNRPSRRSRLPIERASHWLRTRQRLAGRMRMLQPAHRGLMDTIASGGSLQLKRPDPEVRAGCLLAQHATCRVSTSGHSPIHVDGLTRRNPTLQRPRQRRVRALRTPCEGHK